LLDSLFYQFIFLPIVWNKNNI